MYLKANVDDGGRRSTLETYPLITKAHARIQEFSSGGGGGGVQVSLTKKSSDVFFCFCFFFSPQLILQKSNGQFQRNRSFFKVPEGVQYFPGRGGGVQLFPGVGPIAYSL